MRLDFKSYSVEVDAEATRRAYEALPRTDEACTCSGCRNFSLAIGDALGEGGRRFFEELGVDPAKPTEACVNDALGGADGTLLYGAWYHLFGRIERRVETVPDVTAPEWGKDVERDVGDNASILFSDKRIDLKEDVFSGRADVVQMELFADVPWVMDGPNPYLDE